MSPVSGVARLWYKRASIESRGVRYQFALGTALLLAIPLLSLWYLRSAQTYELFGHDFVWTLLFTFLTAVLALAGYVVLRSGTRR